MALLIQFGPLIGPIPTNYLDTMFGSVAAATVINCQSSGTNTIVLTPRAGSPTLPGYITGQVFSFIAPATNTGNVTVNIQSLGPIPLLAPGGAELLAGAILGGSFVMVGTDGAGKAYLILGGASLPPDIAYFDHVTQWTKQVSGGAPVVLTDASNVSWDMSLGNTFQLTATTTVGNTRTLLATTSAVNGDTGVFYFIQDAVGGRSFVASSANNFFWAGATQATGSSGTGAVDKYGYSVRGGKVYMDLVGKAYA